VGPIEVAPGEAAPDEAPTLEGFPLGFAPEQDLPRLAASESEGMAAFASDGGIIELEPNVIKGNARLTNQNPELLALLAADPWHVNGASNNNNIAYATATSTRPSGYSAETTTIQFKSPSEYDFTLLVESSVGGDAGVVYTVRARRGAYNLPAVTGVVVRPRTEQPNPTEVKLEACVGAVQFEFGVDDQCETPSPAFLSALVKDITTFRVPNQQRYAAYFTDGTTTKTTLYYNVRGKDGRTYAFGRPVEWTATCDQLVRICTPLSDDLVQRPQGNLTGPWEVIGETSTHTRSITATYLALPTITRGLGVLSPPTSPVSDPSTWWTMSSSMDEGTWGLQGAGYLRKGREFTRFVTSALSPVTAAVPVTASVIAGQTTPVTQVVEGETRHAFAMRPAYFYGAVRLVDPSIPLYPGSRSTLESLWFEADYDTNGDGIPNDVRIGQRGTYLRATTAAAGFSHTAFPRGFDRTSGELASTYEQALPNPYDLPRTWNQENLHLRFWSQGESPNTRPGLYDEALFRYGILSIAQSSRSALLGAGQRKRIDHEYCFNEVQLQYATTLGRFYNPFADVSGAFNGRDWRDLPNIYSTSGRFYGIPAIWGSTPLATEPRTEGSLTMALPQGTYTLKPGAYMMSDDGTVNTATFAPLSVTLGCGQRVKIVPPLSVSISSPSGCAGSPTIPISGVVKSKPAVVDRLWYRLNGGPEVTLCTNCGLDPLYAFQLELQTCENTLEVFAFTQGMPEPAIGVARFAWDDPADGPTCAGNCVNRPPVARCRGVTISADAACTGCTSVDDGSYDPNENDTFSCVQTPGCPYVRGSQKVTLTCTDKLGLSSSCEATVTVQDTTPPALVCPAETPVLECREGGAVATYTPGATDNCGAVSTRCDPASGSRFPLGTTETSCTATDSAGNAASCAIPVTVRDSEPPTLSCPAPVTAECVGGAASVKPPAATAGDTCALADVTQPAEASFPLGSTPVTYTATDASGQRVSCTSSVNVVDTRAPTLVLNGPAVLTMTRGPSYTEQGATASDACEGDLSPSVRLSGTVDPTTVGSYTVTYTVTDGSGQTVSTTRTVQVVADPGICSASGQWASTGVLADVRQLHTTTALPSGEVLVVGGYTSGTELYDPTTGTWKATGHGMTTHRGHTATLLPDGQVLVAGGAGGNASVSSELYDPASGLWLPTGSMSTARRYHTASLLPGGRVLVTGGANELGLTQASAELYDPVSRLWLPTGSMSTARGDHTATVLADGKVLVAGGLGGSGMPQASAELYDPVSGTWTSVGGMTTARRYHTASLLPGGEVLVTGGGGTHALSKTTELYDPDSKSWSASAPMGTGRRYHTATVLKDGRVLIAGGYNQYEGILTSTELYNSYSNSWCPAGHMAVDRYGHTATLLGDGRVLMTAGFNNRAPQSRSAELYTP
jgi:hypothetical protein